MLIAEERTLIEAVEFVHSNGVRDANIRLDQWLLDSERSARLSDFNSSGYDKCPPLGLESEKAIRNEAPSHFMPRDPSGNNSVRSDLFAVGSALYELEHGSAPYADIEEGIYHRTLHCSRLSVSVKHATGMYHLGSMERHF